MLFWLPFSIQIFPLKPLLVYGRIMTGIVGDDKVTMRRISAFGWSSDLQDWPEMNFIQP